MKTEIRPTPETDAEENKHGNGNAMHAHCHDSSHLSGDFADFARKLERERDEARDLAARLERENENLRNALHLAESAYRDAIASSDRFESLYNDLRWLPLSRLTPTEYDANSCGDVEWSDGSDIWEAAYSNPKNATHWRSISLPSND